MTPSSPSSLEFPLTAARLSAIVGAALAEDLGEAGDITTRACGLDAKTVKAEIVARADGVVAGTTAALCAFKLVDSAISATIAKPDGSRVKAGDVLCALDGPAAGILTGERVALNFLGMLSGVATATAELVAAVRGTRARIACTRKTTPGLRAFEKHAVRCGGGVNHRFGLYDAVMLKDNHIAACGGVVAALRAAKAHMGHTVRIQIEVDTLHQLKEVLSEGVDSVLLDNMPLGDLEKAVAMRAAAGMTDRLILEASGNVTIETVRAIAETGVDIISSGWITHSAPTLDVGLDFKK